MFEISKKTGNYGPTDEDGEANVVVYRKMGKDIREAANKKIAAMESKITEVKKSVEPLMRKYDVNPDDLFQKTSQLVPTHPHHPVPTAMPAMANSAGIHLMHNNDPVVQRIVKPLRDQVEALDKECALLMKAKMEVTALEHQIIYTKVFLSVNDIREYSLSHHEVQTLFNVV